MTTSKHRQSLWQARCAVVSLLSIVVTTCMAQSAYQIGLGSTNTLDTYLAQEKFSGKGFTFLYTSQSRRQESPWSWMVQQQVNLSLPEHKSTRADEMEGAYSLYVGRYHEWNVLDNHLRLEAGALAAATAGFIYLTQNSNNPAQARLSLQVMPSAVAETNFRIAQSHSFALRYEADLPLVGVAFSPNFGQSYYEIFSLGNYDHNIVPTTFISAPSIRQQLTLGYQLGHTSMLTIGYLGDYQQLSVNNIKQHIYSHRIMVGFVKNIRM